MENRKFKQVSFSDFSEEEKKLIRIGYYMEEAKKTGRGGARKGAGRKPRADSERLTYKSVYLFPHEWESLAELGASLNLSAAQAAAEVLRRHLQTR